MLKIFSVLTFAANQMTNDWFCDFEIILSVSAQVECQHWNIQTHPYMNCRAVEKEEVEVEVEIVEAEDMGREEVEAEDVEKLAN